MSLFWRALCLAENSNGRMDIGKKQQFLPYSNQTMVLLGAPLLQEHRFIKQHGSERALHDTCNSRIKADLSITLGHTINDRIVNAIKNKTVPPPLTVFLPLITFSEGVFALTSPPPLFIFNLLQNGLSLNTPLFLQILTVTP